MSEQKVKLAVPLLFPEPASPIPLTGDSRLSRLVAALENRRGIQRVHIDQAGEAARLCLHYDPQQVALADVQRIARRAGTEIANRYHHHELPLEGMDCSDCALVVEHSLGRMEGVLSANVNYAAQSMRVEYDARLTSRRAIEKRVASLGYRVPPAGVRSWYAENRALIFSLLGGLALLTAWLAERYWRLPQPLGLGVFALVYLLTGYDVTRHALGSLRARQFNTDVLMVAAALGAAALGEWAEGGLLLFLFGLGHALEDLLLDRARRQIRALADLTPATALVQRAGREIQVPVDELALDEVVIVRPGERLPVDGEVIAGSSAVNQAPVTGEALPVAVVVGSRLFAGSLNGSGALEVRVKRLARDSTLNRVVRLVERAQTQKAPTQQAADRFTRLLVPGVLLADLLLLLVPPLFGVPWRTAFLRAMTLLVAASPCALALGTPAAVLAGLAQAARHGVLIKGGRHLESLAALRAIAFDKTGTLTEGQLEVVQIEVTALPGSQLLPPDPSNLHLSPPDALLFLAAAVEARSAHPLAGAVLRAARARGLAVSAAEQLEDQPGRGVKARLDGKQALLGSPRWLAEQGAPLPPGAHRLALQREAEGQTVIALALGGQALGFLVCADRLRPGAADAMQSLARLGLARRVMLTGDAPAAAAAMARQAGLSEFRAGLLPEDKLEAIQTLDGQFGPAAMVGDGINDAPALARATVGIAMGGAASGVALETADVAVLGADLGRLPYAIGLGRATRRVIRQNLVVALGVMALLSLLAAGGLAGIGPAIFFHEGSTLLVVLNALRLLRYNQPT